MNVKLRPVVFSAVQWFENGDHPDDEIRQVPYLDREGTFDSEGKVVRRFRHPNVPSDHICSNCGEKYHIHGWIDSGMDGQTVCPGQWVVDVGNRKYEVLNHGEFISKYEAIDE
jgi:hypothetical protein